MKDQRKSWFLLKPLKHSLSGFYLICQLLLPSMTYKFDENLVLFLRMHDIVVQTCRK